MRNVKISQRHLELLSIEDMLKYQKEQYANYASAKGVCLQFNGYGEYRIIKFVGDEVLFETKSPVDAMEKYKEFVIENS